MNKSPIIAYEPWPALPYEDFKPTAYFLQRALQVFGKLKLFTPFEPHWANIVLFITSSGLTTGPIPYGAGTYTIDVDILSHEIICKTSWGKMSGFEIFPCSVAQFTQLVFDMLHGVDINVTINLMPQEVSEPIPFHEDKKPCPYDVDLVNAWWRILVSSDRVLKIFHSRFMGITPPIGFMWGTFDLRDARYLNKSVPIQPGTGYIARNSYDAYQIETGWSSGDGRYPHPAFFSFTYPKPVGIEKAKVEPAQAFWKEEMSEFLLDYDIICNSADPEKDLLAFCESTYRVSSELSGWDPYLVCSGKPI